MWNNFWNEDCELRKYKFKWRYDRRSGNCNLSNCKLTRKNFRDFHGILTHGLCVSAAVLYQLIYEDPYIGSRPICWVILTHELSPSISQLRNRWNIWSFGRCGYWKRKKNEQTKTKTKIWDGWPWMYKKWLNYWLKYTYSNLNLLSVPNLCFLQFQYPHLHNDSIFDFFPYMFALRVRRCMFPLPCSIPCKVTVLFV